MKMVLNYKATIVFKIMKDVSSFNIHQSYARIRTRYRSPRILNKIERQKGQEIKSEKHAFLKVQQLFATETTANSPPRLYPP